MTQQHTCQVLIVGGGPVGLVMACLLAQHGVDVVVLERRTHPRQYSRAIGLHPPALAVLNAVRLEEAAVAEGRRVHSGAAYSRGRRLGELSFRAGLAGSAVCADAAAEPHGSPVVPAISRPGAGRTAPGLGSPHDQGSRTLRPGSTSGGARPQHDPAWPAR